VSDCHSLDSQLDESSRPAPLNDARPSPAPCSVKLAEPVEALLMLRTVLNSSASADQALDTLPAFIPEVMDTYRVAEVPILILQRMTLSDAHSVLSECEIGEVIFEVNAEIPKFSPYRDKLMLPVAKKFDLTFFTDKTICDLLEDSAVVTLPELLPELITSRCDCD
jgi:hypothetical protein